MTGRACADREVGSKLKGRRQCWRQAKKRYVWIYVLKNFPGAFIMPPPSLPPCLLPFFPSFLHYFLSSFFLIIFIEYACARDCWVLAIQRVLHSIVKVRNVNHQLYNSWESDMINVFIVCAWNQRKITWHGWRNQAKRFGGGGTALTPKAKKTRWKLYVQGHPR